MPLELQRGRTLTELSVHPNYKTVNWSVDFFFTCSYFLMMTWSASNVHYHVHTTEKPPPPNPAEESKLSFKMTWESGLLRNKVFENCFPFPQPIVMLYPNSCCAILWKPLGHVLSKLSCFLVQHNFAGSISMDNHPLGFSFKENNQSFAHFLFWTAALFQCIYNVRKSVYSWFDF